MTSPNALNLQAAWANLQDAMRRHKIFSAPAATGSAVGKLAECAIIGTPAVGVACSFAQTSVSGTPPFTRTQQWKLDGTDISGQTAVTYTPVSGDVGKTLSIVEAIDNAYGPAVTSTSAGVAVVTSAGVAPAYASGVSGLAVIIGQPVVGATCDVLDGILSQGSPTPTKTYQWYRGDSGLLADAGEAISGATSSSYTFTNGEYMKFVWRVTTATNASGSATSTSWKTRCIPAGLTVGQGPTADAGESNDPRDATAYSATTLYKSGAVVTNTGSTYLLLQPYAYGIAPTDGTTWAVITTVYYIDPDLGNDGNAGTFAAPWQTVEAINKKITYGITGYVATPAKTLFLFKRGATAKNSGEIQVSASSAGYFYFGSYGTGIRPAFKWAPPPQAHITQAGCKLVCAYLGKPGCRFWNINFEDANSIDFTVTGITGTFNAGDVVSFPSGATGTFVTSYTAFSSTHYVVALIGTITDGTSPVAGGAITSSSGGAATASAVNQISSNSTLTYTASFTNCNFTNFSGGCVGVDNTADVTRGDFYVLNCALSRCGAITTNGSGAGSSHSARVNVWFTRVADSGTPDSIRNHQLYCGSLSDSSFIGNDITMSANYGNVGFNYHGNADTIEVAWNRIKGSRSGIGITQGYGAGQTENMYRFHVHHNLIRDIGKGVGQGSASIGWEVCCIQDSRIHDNVTINSTDSAFYDWRNSGSTATKLGNTVIAQNTFWNARAFADNFSGVHGALITNLTIENNVLAGSGTTQPFNKGNSLPDAQLTEDANLFYRTDGGAVIQWNIGGTVENFLRASALHKAHSAFEAVGVTGDPLFTSTTAGSEDLSLQAGSPAKLAGLDVRRAVGYAADYTGAARSTTTPSIGAYE